MVGESDELRPHDEVAVPVLNWITQNPYPAIGVGLFILFALEIVVKPFKRAKVK